MPEWRAKYLNYKASCLYNDNPVSADCSADRPIFSQLGKKKIKAISRALQKVNRTPPRRQLGEFRDYSPHHRPPNTSTSVTRFPLDYPPPKDGSATARTPTPSRTAAVSASEHRPLRTPGSRFSTIVGGYGSIVSEPPDTAGSDLPSLALPDPAIDPQNDESSAKGLAGAASVELPPKGSPPQATSACPQRDPSYLFLPEGKSPFVRRSSSIAEESFSRRATFFRRMFTTGDLGSPGKSFQGSVYSEIDRKQDEFFEFLDDELDKIESFYRQKEQEATDRLKVLRQQLHMMRDQRAAEVLSAKNAASHDKNGHTNGHGLGVLPASKWTQAIVGKHRFGKNSRALVDLRTPLGPVPADLSGSVFDRRDFARRQPELPAVPYRTAKRKLKQALQEFYRGLELLKAYADLNRKAFRKINKKYDKVVNMRPTLRYMSDKVNHAYFVKSEVIEGHMVIVEDLYARYFERGNRKVAVSKLRGKNGPGDFSPNTFRAGLFIATGMICCIQGLILGMRLLNDLDPAVRAQTSYLLQVCLPFFGMTLLVAHSWPQIYGGYFLVVFHFLLFCLDCMIWTKTKINYTFVFEFDTRHVLDWRQLSEVRLDRPALDCRVDF